MIKISVFLFYFLVLLLCIGQFAFFYYTVVEVPSSLLQIQAYVMVIFATLFNFFLVIFGLSKHKLPHPKYLIITRQKISLLFHIIVGVFIKALCLVTFFTAYFGQNDVSIICAKVTAYLILILHTPSIYNLIRNLNGARAIILPLNIFVLNYYIFCAVRLLIEPMSTFWLVNLYLILGSGEWTASFFTLLSHFRIMEDRIYTMASLLPLFLLGPTCWGMLGNLFFIVNIALYIILYNLILRPDEKERKLMYYERNRELLLNAPMHAQWVKLKSEQVNLENNTELSDKELAQRVFDLLDKNKSGFITAEDVTVLLREWHTSEQYIKRFSIESNVSFDRFYKHVWSLSKNIVIDKSNKFQHLEKKTLIDIEKARLVFDAIDLNGDGFIDKLELQKLLIQWGFKENEADVYLKDEENKCYSFDEFFHKMRPMWAYAYKNVILNR